MRRSFIRHKAALGYVTLVLVAILAVEIHHYETTNEISRAATLACRSSTRLAENQRTVIQTLVVLIAAESMEQDEHPELRVQLADLVARLKNIPTFDCKGITR